MLAAFSYLNQSIATIFERRIVVWMPQFLLSVLQSFEALFLDHALAGLLGPRALCWLIGGIGGGRCNVVGALVGKWIGRR